MNPTVDDALDALAHAVRVGEQRGVARALTLAERGGQRGDELLRRVRPLAGRARVVGLTGSPGSGKSTLGDALIAAWRALGLKVMSWTIHSPLEAQEARRGADQIVFEGFDPDA